jgi:hypothetical protein
VTAEFTEGQKALIAEIAEARARTLLADGGYVKAEALRETAIEKGLVPESDVSRSAEGPRSIPDEGRTSTIAREATTDWWEERVPWWDVRRSISARVGAGTLAAVLLVGLLDAALDRLDLFGPGWHLLVGTERKIEDELREFAVRWKEEAQGSAVSEMEDAVKTRLGFWLQQPDVRGRIGSAIRTIAEDNGADNPIGALIARAIEERPLLMFHGEAELGRPRSVTVIDEGCAARISHWFQRMPEVVPPPVGPDFIGPLSAHDPNDFAALSSRIGQNCRVRGLAYEPDVLELPFYARIHREPVSDDQPVPPDRIHVMLHLTGLAYPILEPSDPHVEAVQPRAFDVAPGEINVSYVSFDRNLQETEGEPFELRLTGFSGNADGFFHALVDDDIFEATFPTSQGLNPTPRELVHTIRISLPERFVPQLLESEPDGRAGVEWVPTVRVRAFVLVNKQRLE